jgi:membrane fusion protein (multidrug efflux system)
VAGEWVDLDGGKAWVIREGLKAGDQVIVDGLMRIGPGAPVQVAQAGAVAGGPPAAAASAASAPAKPASK